jgi:peptidoglycan hydrolase-like protein with peptidoglycan-binding domain
MRMTTPLLGAAIGGGIGMLKRDPAKYALWGAGIGLLVTFMGGAAVSVGGISIRVGVDSHVSVMQAQMMLKQLGYTVEMDGTLGPMTVAALKATQTSCGLRPDGKLSDATLDCLTRLILLPSGPIGTSGEYFT